MKELVIGDGEAGKRFDKLLFTYLNEAPSSFVYKMLRKKNITLNGKKATGSEKLATGDVVKIFLADETFDKFHKAPKEDNTNKNLLKTQVAKLSVIYEDDNFILMNKPYGMLSQKAKPEDISINEIMLEYLKEKNDKSMHSPDTFKPSICNRLDRNTTGIIIGGKSLKGLQTAAEMLKLRSADKYYLALVSGRIEDASLIKGYLHKNEHTNKVVIKNKSDDTEETFCNDSQHDELNSAETKTTENATYIETYYEPLAARNDMTLVKVKLITGKTHQIRAHLSSIGHPIIGDPKYGSEKINIQFRDKYGIRHQLLHAYEFVFPELSGDFSYISKKAFTAEPPKAFRIMIDEIGEEHGNLEFQRLKRKLS